MRSARRSLGVPRGGINRMAAWAGAAGPGTAGIGDGPEDRALKRIARAAFAAAPG